MDNIKCKRCDQDLSAGYTKTIDPVTMSVVKLCLDCSNDLKRLKEDKDDDTEIKIFKNNSFDNIEVIDDKVNINYKWLDS